MNDYKNILDPLIEIITERLFLSRTSNQNLPCQDNNSKDAEIRLANSNSSIDNLFSSNQFNNRSMMTREEQQKYLNSITIGLPYCENHIQADTQDYNLLELPLHQNGNDFSTNTERFHLQSRISNQNPLCQDNNSKDVGYYLDLSNQSIYNRLSLDPFKYQQKMTHEEQQKNHASIATGLSIYKNFIPATIH